MRKTLLLSLSALAFAGCAKPRTSAATYPNLVAFDPAQSSPEAIEVVDASIEVLGGAAQWTKLQQVHFKVDYKSVEKVDDKAVAKAVESSEHTWDRWHARHYIETPDMDTMGGDPKDIKYIEVRRPHLFDTKAKQFAFYDGRAVPPGESTKMLTMAKKRLIQDLNFLAIYHRLKDPGVKLQIDAAPVQVDSDICKPSCTSIKVTFDPAIDKDTWFISFNNETKFPVMVGMKKDEGRTGFEIVGWNSAGGLQWPAKLQNLGFASEVVEFSDISVSDSDEDNPLFFPKLN